MIWNHLGGVIVYRSPGPITKNGVLLFWLIFQRCQPMSSNHLNRGHRTNINLSNICLFQDTEIHPDSLGENQTKLDFALSKLNLEINILHGLQELMYDFSVRLPWVPLSHENRQIPLIEFCYFHTATS